MDVPKFAVLTDVVLYKMYLETVNGESSWFGYGEVAKLFNGKVSRGFVDKCVGSLIGRKLVESEHGSDSIAGHGILYVEKQLEDGDSIIFKYDKYGDPWLDKQTVGARDEGDQANLGDTEPQEEKWEPLPIDRESPEFEKAVDALDDAIGKIEADNGYAANQPEERDNVVWSLRQGIAALKEMTPSLAQVRALIIAPLNSAITTFKESVPGVAAIFAREALKEWIKSLFR